MQHKQVQPKKIGPVRLSEDIYNYQVFPYLSAIDFARLNQASHDFKSLVEKYLKQTENQIFYAIIPGNTVEVGTRKNGSSAYTELKINKSVSTAQILRNFKRELTNNGSTMFVFLSEQEALNYYGQPKELYVDTNRSSAFASPAYKVQLIHARVSYTYQRRQKLANVSEFKNDIKYGREIYFINTTNLLPLTASVKFFADRSHYILADNVNLRNADEKEKVELPKKSRGKCIIM